MILNKYINKYFYSFFFILIVIDLYRINYTTPNNYRLIHWLIDYSQGFIKRGFIGHLLVNIIGDYAKQKITLYIISSLISLLMIFLLSLIILKYVTFFKIKYRLLILLFFVSSPALYLLIFQEIGRFDQLLIIPSLLIANLLIYNNKPKSKRFWLCVIAVLVIISSVGLLIHEGSIFLTIPTSIALIYIVFRKKLNLSIKLSCYIYIYIYITMFIFSIIIIKLGTPSGDQIQNLLVSVSNSQTFIPHDIVYSPIKSPIPFLQQNLKTAITYTFNEKKAIKSSLYGFSIFIAAMPYIIFLSRLIWLLSQRKYSNLKKYLFTSQEIIILSCVPLLFSIPIYILGIDWGRWLCFSLLCSTVILIVISILEAIDVCSLLSFKKYDLSLNSSLYLILLILLYYQIRFGAIHRVYAPNLRELFLMR